MAPKEDMAPRNDGNDLFQDDHDDQDIEEQEDQEEDTSDDASSSTLESIEFDLKTLRLDVLANVIFVVSSSFYVAMEVIVLPYYQWYRDIPVSVREATDDATWWEYYNETDAFPDYVLNATDDYTWYEWYNSTFMDTADMREYVFQVP